MCVYFQLRRLEGLQPTPHPSHPAALWPSGPLPPPDLAPQLPSLAGSQEAVVVRMEIALQLQSIQQHRKDLLKASMVTMTHPLPVQRQLKDWGRAQPEKGPAPTC